MSSTQIRSVVLYVADPSSSQHFYERALGARPGSISHGRVELDVGGVRLLLHPTSTDEQDRSEARHGRAEIYFLVDDVDATVTRLRQAGAEVIQEPTDQPWGERDAVVLDPDDFPLFLTQATR